MYVYQYLNHQMYDPALLTKCYTQHVLRPLRDSEAYHKRYFIEIHFIKLRFDLVYLRIDP